MKYPGQIQQKAGITLLSGIEKPTKGLNLEYITEMFRVLSVHFLLENVSCMAAAGDKWCNSASVHLVP